MALTRPLLLWLVPYTPDLPSASLRAAYESFRVVLILRRPHEKAGELRAHLRRLAAYAREADVEIGVNCGGAERDEPLEAFVRAARELGATWLQVPERAAQEWSGGSGLEHVVRSCHDLAGIDQALRAGASFCTLSPIFATPSKPGARGLGVEALRVASARYPGKLLALGGVVPEHLDALLAAGAVGVASVRNVPAFIASKAASNRG